MTAREPRLAYFYHLKKLILQEIVAKGEDVPASTSHAWSEDWSREVSLSTYLESIEKMIEALAALRDFEKEPLTAKEENDLNEIWLFENALK